MASVVGAATKTVVGAASRSTWSRIKSVPVQYPFAFGFVVSGFKTSFSDLLVQKVVEQREEIDWKRNGAFACFGFFYLGGVQYALYVPFFGRLFPGAAAFAAKSVRNKIKDARGMFNVGAQVFLDQCVHDPLMYFPVFYCTKELVMSDKPDFVRVLNEYRTNMKEDLTALWKIWVPATIFNFAFMPMWARIPTAACTSLVWTCILSSMRGGDVSHGQDMAGGEVTGATLAMMEEGLGVIFTQPVELARDKHHLVISASGLDKVGWTAMMSRAVAEAGGNVTHSKMVRLGTEFIIVMHVAVEPENQRKLIKALKKDKDLKDLHIQTNSIARRMTGTYQPPVMGVRLRCVGLDK
jgi:predicted amino acid-binding ACT domain protein